MTLHMTPNVVSSPILFTLHAPTGDVFEVRAVLTWRRQDPVAVSIEFLSRIHDGVKWVFARSLLADGLTRWTGSGDIRIGPAFALSGRRLHTGISLTSPSGTAELTADTEALAAFIHATFARVPEGYEFAACDWNAELRALLASGELDASGIPDDGREIW